VAGLLSAVVAQYHEIMAHWGNRDNPSRQPSYRSAHRARSHESAHAEQAAPPEPPRIDHPLVPAGPASIVRQPEELRRLLKQLRDAGQFAYDSEFIGELTYIPKLCLVQVASAQQIALIDPLAGLDMRPFWELITDPAVEKVVHAGLQDLEPVVRELNRAPANVFDTQIAAAFVALPFPLSLSKLVAELTGARLGKGLTFTHWDQRPLSAMQLRYAVDDVRYLLLARQRIGQRLSESGRTDWANEECAAQCDPQLYRFDPAQQYLRVRGASGLSPRNLAILRELTIWRDAAARLTNVPPRAFLKDEVLLDLARNPIKSIDRLHRVKGLPRPVEAEYGGQIVEMTSRALALNESQLPAIRETEPSPPEKFRVDALWAVAQSLCAGQSIDVAVATNRQEIGEFYQRLGGSAEVAVPHRLLSGWRKAALGDALAAMIRGEAGIELSWVDSTLRAGVRRG